MTMEFRLCRYLNATDLELLVKAATDQMLKHRRTIETAGLTAGSGILVYMATVLMASTLIFPLPRALVAQSLEFQRRVEEHLRDSTQKYQDIAVTRSEVEHLSRRLVVIETKLDAIKESQAAQQIVAAANERSVSILQFLCSAAVLGCIGTLGKAVWDGVMGKARRES